MAAVAVLALLNQFGLGWAATAWPLLLLAAGALLLIFIYPRHPVADWSAIWNDPQQRQHTLIAVAIAWAGALELIGWRFGWPLAAMLVGVLFLSHTQHGTGHAMSRAVLLHRRLGLTVIMGAALRAAEIITGAELLAWLWPLALLAAAAQLIIYHEPEGAFESADMHMGSHS
ncbi:MAG: hypothetical protein HY259_05985 [Chloroflexi bacterium]|nr:hypothetical protein [Chloroflexota bacterium]